MRIAIIGLGLVALSDALAMARKHQVVLTGPVPDRVDAINAGRYPLPDPNLDAYVAGNPLMLSATVDTHAALKGADLVLVSAPLSLDAPDANPETTELESRIELAHRLCPGVPIVIRSTVPVGFTKMMRERLSSPSLVYVPEFLREGHALPDTLAPRFLVVGDRGALGSRVAAIMLSALDISGVPTRLTGPSEAEAIRHFSQAYLALRVGYFNELDSYAMTHGLQARPMIDGICLDPRIGFGMNNPCFGAGGERLRRSTAELAHLYGDAPASILPMMTQANEARLKLLTDAILTRGARRVGVWHGARGEGRGPLDDLSRHLSAAGAEVAHLATDEDLHALGADCDVIVAQRLSAELAPFAAKVFCRDHYAA